MLSVTIATSLMAGGSLLRWRANLPALGDGPGHRRDRLHRLARRAAAGRARRRGGAGRRGGLAGRRDRRARPAARQVRRARSARGPARAARGRAGVPLRGGHVGAAGGRRAPVRRQRARHEARHGGVPARRGRARGLHLERRGRRPGGARQDRGRDAAVHGAARLGIPYVNSVHEGEVEAMRVAARGLPLVCVNPAICFGAGDHLLASTRLVRSFLLGRIPVYTEGAVSVVDVRDVAEAHLLADRRGHPGERYILGGRNFTFERLFADLGRLSGIDPPVRLPASAARAAAACWRRRGVAGRSRRSRCAPPATGGPTARPRRGASWAGARGRTRRRSRPRSPGTSSASRIGSRARAARSRCSSAWPEPPSGRPRALCGCCAAPRPRVPSIRRVAVALPLQGAHRPGLPLRQGRPPAARRGHRVRGGQGPVPQARPPRDRGVDRAALGTGPRARRRGRSTTRTASSSTWTGSRAQGELA